MTVETEGSLVSLDVPIDSPSDMRREVARRVDEAIVGVRPRWDCERCDMCLVSECLSTRPMDRLSVAGGEP